MDCASFTYRVIFFPYPISEPPIDMPERVNLVDDLPPIAESKNVSTPTLLEASEVVELETAAFLDPFSGEEVVPGSSVPGS